MFRIVRMLVLALAVLATSMTTTNAQGTAGNIVSQTENTAWYEVISQDNPWNLFGPKWTDLVELNPWLTTSNRIDYRSPDDVHVLIHPKERLQLNDELRAILEARGVRVIRVMPPPTPVAPPALQAPANNQDPDIAATQATSWPWFIWLALLVMAGLIASSAWRTYQTSNRREREMRLDPVNSGTPYVPGGIPPTEPQQLANFFDQQAVSRYAARHPNVDRSSIRPTRIGPIERGTIVGEGEVGYLGQGFRPRRIEQPIDAYRALYRFPDGTQENIITLQGCMNPVAYGGDTYRGFTFTLHQAEPRVPEPTPAPSPAPHPAMAMRAIRTEAEVNRQSTIEIGDRMLVFDHGVHLKVDPETGAINFQGDAFSMTLQPKKIAKPRAAKPRTGTDQ